MSEAIEVLLVEDDRNEIAVALRAVERAGIEVDVEVAHDGQEALEALGLEARAGEMEEAVASGSVTHPREKLRPRVVFLDLKMPRVDGWKVLERLRSEPTTRNLPIVILSASDRGDDIRRCYEMGANSFLVKRFDPRGPGAYFVDALRYWLDLNLVTEGESS